MLKTLREVAAERLPEVQSISHKVANAMVIDAWDRAQAARQEQAAAAKAADLAEADRVARAVRDGIIEDHAAALERRARSKEATLILRAQQEEEAERKALEEEALALDLAHLEQRNRALEAAGEAKRAAAAEAQRALRAQLAEANGAARQRAEAEREKDRAADATALAFVVAKQREEVARQQAADAARRERDRAFAAMLQTSQRAASSAAGDDEYKAKLAREALVLAQRAKDRAAAEERAAFVRSIKEGTAEQLRARQEQRDRERAEDEQACAAAAAAALVAAREEAARSEAARMARDAFKTGLLTQVAEREAARDSLRGEPLAERLARERDELRRKIAVEEAHARKLADARAAGVSDKALRAAGLLPRK